MAAVGAAPAVATPGGAAPGVAGRDGRGGLAEEVSAALDRFFGRA
jgi:hypothetical protein